VEVEVEVAVGLPLEVVAYLPKAAVGHLQATAGRLLVALGHQQAAVERLQAGRLKMVGLHLLTEEHLKVVAVHLPREEHLKVRALR
jgi:hypothetical protein